MAESDDLERRFDAAMLEIYERAGEELGYWATRYLQMLRRLGGLGTARRLINSPTTSDGYAQLRAAGRLDLTVEAYATREEFQPLFTAAELRRAANRLGYYRDLDRAERRPDPTTSASLRPILDQAAAASPQDRVGFRDAVAALGAPAIPVLEEWVAAGNSPGFACTVIEAIGNAGDRASARNALWRLRPQHPDWMSIIDAAIARLGRRGN